MKSIADIIGKSIVKDLQKDPRFLYADIIDNWSKYVQNDCYNLFKPTKFQLNANKVTFFLEGTSSACMQFPYFKPLLIKSIGSIISIDCDFKIKAILRNK